MMFNNGQNWYNDINTNVYKVTSLEEAIMRSNMRQSEMVYFNQSKNEFYNVRVDMNGNKSWQTFCYDVPNINGNNPVVSREEFDALVAKVDSLANKSAEVTENA